MQDRFGLTPFGDFGGNALFKSLVELLERFDGAYPVDGCAEEVCDGLEEIDVVLAERARSAIVGFEHAERFAVPHQDDVYGARY